MRIPINSEEALVGDLRPGLPQDRSVLKLDDSPPLTEGRRGSERRRHLLAYLREHPEELL